MNPLKITFRYGGLTLERDLGSKWIAVLIMLLCVLGLLVLNSEGDDHED